jgi:large subunit ribosomal protein L10
VVKNSLAKTAVKGTALEPLTELIDGPCAVAYGGEGLVALVRDLIAKAKDLANLEFRGAVMGGEVFGADQIDALSKYPTLDEARSQTVQLFLSPARNLAGSIGSPAAKLAGIIKTIEEKLEKGETIAKA